MLLPLTRAANLCDFDGLCASVGAWQQRHADAATTRWAAKLGGPEVGLVAAINWGASPFVAPVGPATYYDSGSSIVLADRSHAIIYAFSVLDRTPEPRRLLKQIHAALVPGGLLVATFAIWDADGPDVAYGHGLRSRIYDRLGWKRLIEEVRGLGYHTFGGVDLRYPGDTIGDHSLGALVVTKEQA